MANWPSRFRSAADLRCIDSCLNRLAARFGRIVVVRDHHGFTTPVSKVVDAVLPYPVDALGGFVAQIVAAKVAARKSMNGTVSPYVAWSWWIFVASSLRRLLVLVKSPADLASMRIGSRSFRGFLGWITTSSGMLTLSVLPTARFMRKAYVPASISVSGFPVDGLACDSRACRVVADHGELPLLLGVADDRVCHGAARRSATIVDARSRSWWLGVFFPSNHGKMSRSKRAIEMLQSFQLLSRSATCILGI